MKYSILFLLFILSINSFSQDLNKQKRYHKNNSNNTRYFIGFYPSKASVINGWTIGDFSFYSSTSQNHQVKMNGLYTNLDPLQALLSFYVVFGTPWMIFGDKKVSINKSGSIYSQIDNTDIDKYNNRQLNIINGMSLGITHVGCDNLKTNGIEFCILAQDTYENNGISISGLTNKKTKFNGIMIGLINLSNIGNGLQIGLINNCGDCNGIQIGLINRCGKRTFPIINFRFKQDK